MFGVIGRSIRVLAENDMRRQIVIAMVLVAILPLIVLSVSLYYFHTMPLITAFINQNRDLMEKQLATEQSARSRTMAHELASFFRTMEIHAAVLTGVADNGTLPMVYRQAVIREYLDRFPGIVWMQSGGGVQVGVTDSGMQAIFDSAISGDLAMYGVGHEGMSISVPMQITAHSSESLVVVSMPSIVNPEGRITLLAELPPVSKLASQIDPSGGTFVIDGRGTLILKSKTIPVELGRDMASLNGIREFIRSAVTDRVFHIKLDDGVVYRGVVSRVDMVGWGLVTLSEPIRTNGIMSEMESAAVDMLQRLTFATIIGLLSVGLLAGAIGALVAVRFTQPMRKIMSGIAGVGSGDYDLQFAETGPPDIRQLARTLNSMTDSIRNATRDLHMNAEAMRTMFMGSLTALVTAIDAKDPYTRGHSRRVQLISTTIGREMALPTDQLNELELSALMHDIGKLGIEEALLRKPGLLTPDERRALERHPVFGAEIMRHIPMFSNMLPGLLHHHERWDGSGYPDGLIGEKIPLYGRIIAVADTFDAMTSSRPYQETLTPAEARRLIENWSGTRYDPVVVDAFLKQYPHIAMICDTLDSVLK
ncbi:HD domain-containing protein [bacterium]|nr:HD domain-containing protein [candidate division CSSED10-310 bacterium]